MRGRKAEPEGSLICFDFLTSSFILVGVNERLDPTTATRRDGREAAQHEARLEKAVEDALDDMDSKVDRDLDEMLGRDSDGNPVGDR